MSSNEGVISVVRRWTWNRATFDSYLTAASLGIFAGLAVTYINSPLHLPGHKVLFWMVPAVANGMRGTTQGAATITVAAALATAMLLGGNLAGGYAMAPLVVVAGIVLDRAIRQIKRRRLTPRAAFTLLALAGMLANLLCFIKAMANPLGRFLSAANMQDLATVAGSHVLFGMVAAVIGCAVGFALRSKNTRR